MNLFVVPRRLGINVINSQLVNNIQEGDVVYSTHHQKDELGLNFKSIFEVISLLLNGDIKKVYIRDCFDFALIYLLKLICRSNTCIFYDFRAIVYYEMEYKNKSKIKTIIIKALERFAYIKADYIGAVSNNMKSELVRSFGVQKKIYVTPSLSFKNVKRNRVYAKKLIYVGGVSKWQNVDLILKSFSELHKIDSEYTLTLLTSERLSAIKLCSIYSPNSNVKVISANHEDVFDILQNYDLALIVRDSSIINKVASPIKVAEYICAGLIPIISDDVGDFSRELLDLNIGIPFSSSGYELNASIESFLENQDSMTRDRLFDFSKNYCLQHIGRHGFHKFNI